MSESKGILNPQVKTTTIGVRVLREISVYPLSVGEELKLSDVISNAVVSFFDTRARLEDKTEINTENIEFVNMLIDLIRDNVAKVIEITTDEENPEGVLMDMTNEQLVDFATLIYQENFGNLRKKVTDLISVIVPPVDPEAELELKPEQEA